MLSSKTSKTDAKENKSNLYNQINTNNPTGTYNRFENSGSPKLAMVSKTHASKVAAKAKAD